MTEIYGVVHLVTKEDVLADSEQLYSFAQNEGVDWTQEVSMDTYSAGDDAINWKDEMWRIDEEYPVVMFSKVRPSIEQVIRNRTYFVVLFQTYCPYSKRAKALFNKYTLDPKIKIIEVDLRGIYISISLWKTKSNSQFRRFC